jgi:hypothetical protein
MPLVSGNRSLDPAEQAAQLLFRIGFGILCVVLPLTSVFSRRAIVVIAPIGILILISAALMMKGSSQPGASLRRAISSPAGLAALFLIVWSAMSLAWTPFPGAGAERLLRVAASIGIAMGAIVALPERMRASNLYLLSVGIGLSAMVALGVATLQPELSEPTVLDRAAVLISLMAWPAVTWLSMKRRTVPAMGIAGAVGALALVLQGATVLPALLVGAVLLGGALNNLRGSAVAFAVAVAILIIGAPVIALVLSLLSTQASGFGRTMQVWADIILADPMRLVTGHGIETALRNRIAQALDNAAPTSLLFEVWYELGVLGALAMTVVLVASVFSIATLGRTLGAFALGCMGFAFTLATIGLGTSQTWWITALVATAIAFFAVAHGEYRTERPAAISALKRE